MSRTLAPGDKLPSEVEIANALGVSRMTLRQALSAIEAKGLIDRRRGRFGGNFVAAPRFEFDHASLPGFTEQMRRIHVEAGAQVLRATTHRPAADVRQALGLSRGAQVHEILRARSANGEPIVLEEAYLPAAMFPGLLSADLTGSLYAVMRQYDASPFSADEELEATQANDQQAEILGYRTGKPVVVDHPNVVHRGAASRSNSPATTTAPTARGSASSRASNRVLRPATPAAERVRDEVSRQLGHDRRSRGAQLRPGSAAQTAMQCMPAATAARTPGTESSKTSTSLGRRFSMRAAVRKPSGCGLPLLTSSSAIRTLDRFTRRAAVQHRQHVLSLRAGDDADGNPVVRQQFHQLRGGVPRSGCGRRPSACRRPGATAAAR